LFTLLTYLHYAPFSKVAVTRHHRQIGSYACGWLWKEQVQIFSSYFTDGKHYKTSS